MLLTSAAPPHPGPGRREGHHDPGRGLTAADFGGAQYEGCNDQLNLPRPDVIADIHAAYIEAGADLISTNTFVDRPYVLAEYGLAERCPTSLGPRPGSAERVDRPSRGPPRFAIGAMGPGTRTISVTANVTFEEVRDAYYRQARALIEGGMDALLLETCQDTLNVKAAAIGVRQAMTEAGVSLPLMVSGTVEPMGTMLAGQDVTPSTPRSSPGPLLDRAQLRDRPRVHDRPTCARSRPWPRASSRCTRTRACRRARQYEKPRRASPTRCAASWTMAG